MPTSPFQPIDARYCVLPKSDIDTDQIIPARFLKTTERSGLGVHAFQDWRYDATGVPRADFPLNDPRTSGAQVLVAGRNFGCGSSREHAVWALMSAGFRAVISSAFADIFRGNALGNGLLPVEIGDEAVAVLLSAAERAGRDKQPSVRIDLASQTLVLPNAACVRFPIDPFAKHCLLHGVDELDVLLGANEAIASFEAVHQAPVSTLAGGES
jgi:3-isopropylmalate/(R)-2-methylmalate dehydratase small subunit